MISLGRTKTFLFYFLFLFLFCFFLGGGVDQIHPTFEKQHLVSHDINVNVFEWQIFVQVKYKSIIRLVFFVPPLRQHYNEDCKILYKDQLQDLLFNLWELRRGREWSWSKRNFPLIQFDNNFWWYFITPDLPLEPQAQLYLYSSCGSWVMLQIATKAFLFKYMYSFTLMFKTYD